MAGQEMRPARVKLTYDDLLLLPDDGLRHELIDGEHFVTPSPNLRHQQILGRLHLAIGNWLERHPLGHVFFAPLDVVFTRFDVVEPDLLYVSNERSSEALTEAHAKGADLVVEVASPSTRRRDEGIKRLLYERRAVLEYWFVDPERQTVRVYRRASGVFGTPFELTAEKGDALETPLLPGLSVSLPAVFRR